MNADGSNEQKITNTEASEFVAVARTDGAAVAVQRYQIAKVANPRATFFLPGEVELLAREFIDAGRFQDAVLVLDAVLDHQPQYSGVIDELRDAYAPLGRPLPPSDDSIRAVFRRSGGAEGLALLVELSYEFPRWPVLSSSNFTAIADDLIAAGEKKGAILVFRAGVAKYPDRADFHRRLGELYIESGERETGVAYLRRAAELAPDDVGIRRLLAR